MADDNGEATDDERTVELSTLQAIYPELTLDLDQHFQARIDIQVEPYSPLPVVFCKSQAGIPSNTILEPQKTVTVLADAEKSTRGITTRPENGLSVPAEPPPRIQNLSFLPPLVLNIVLPDTYPAEEPPSISISSSWLPLSNMMSLQETGKQIWEEMGRAQILFAYIDFLRDEAERAFGLVSGEPPFFQASTDLEVSLLDYDLKAKRAKFERETFECGICLEPKKGSVCHRLSLCSHVFCVECLKDFYTTCITEGDVARVACTAPGCGNEEKIEPDFEDTGHRRKRRRQDRTLQPNELYEIPLEQETVQRYIKLKRKKFLESDRRTIYCPRDWCQGPARSQKNKFKPISSDNIDSDSDEGEAEPDSYDPNEPKKLPPPAERLAICEDCNFAFCKVCKASWHGEYYVCFPRSQFEISAEEKASTDYMALHTQGCPTCDARAQKTHGCNHMICFKCNTHFCYLCGAFLTSANPYQHYNKPNEGCYMRLWELEGGDGDDIGHRFEGGLQLGELPEAESDDDDDLDENIRRPPHPIAIVRQPLENDAPRVQEIRNEVQHPAHLNQEHQHPIHNPGNLEEANQRQGAPAGIEPRAQQNGDPGLQRFLQLVRDDEEDEWDSDEMEDEGVIA